MRTLRGPEAKTATQTKPEERGPNDGDGKGWTGNEITPATGYPLDPSFTEHHGTTSGTGLVVIKSSRYASTIAES